MVKATFSNQNTEYLIKYRAFCKEDNFKGAWRNNIEKAKADARKHRAELGCYNHELKIVAQQILTMTYEG